MPGYPGDDNDKVHYLREDHLYTNPATLTALDGATFDVFGGVNVNGSPVVTGATFPSNLPFVFVQGTTPAAVQAADDSVASGGLVFFPRADYNLGSTTINKSPSTYWLGQGNHPTGTSVGTDLLYSGEGSAVAITAGVAGQWYGHVKGMRILYTGALGAATTSTGVSISGSAASQIFEDVFISAFRDGISDVGAGRLTLTRSYIYGCQRYGCYMQDADDCVIDGYSQLSGGVHGLYALRCSSLKINGSRLQSSGTANVRVEDTGFFSMVGGLCDSADLGPAGTRIGVQLYGVTYSSITGVTFYSNGLVADVEISSPAGPIRATQTLSFVGNTHQAGGGSKVAYLFKAPVQTCKKITITGNVVDNDTEPLVSFEAPAGGSFSSVSITGNVSKGGILGASNVVDLWVAGNTFVNISTPQEAVVRKSSDQTINNSAVFTDDTQLVFAVGANETWIFTILVLVNGDSTADIKYQMTGPAGSTVVSGAQGPRATDLVMVAGSLPIITLGASSSSTGIPSKIDGSVITAGTAGIVKLQWAQNAATVADTIVKAGSYIWARRAA